MKESPDQVYALLRQAGFTEAGAVTMDAIAGAESGYDDSQVGDRNLVDSIWGTSYGLFQIRTLKQQTGTGGLRDIQTLTDPRAQAHAAYVISKGGTDFSAWTTYTSGAYQKFLDGARALAGAGVLPSSASSSTSSSTSTTPVSLGSSIRPLLLTGLFVAAGAGLVLAGLARSVAPKVRTALQPVERAASKAGNVALMAA